MHQLLARVVIMLLRLRYRLTVSGLDKVDRHQTGVLVLPNHPAEIDPIIISSLLWDTLRPRPIVIESMFSLPLLRPLMKLTRAVPMADMEFESGPFKRRRIERAMRDLGEALQRGENILMYPSGRLSVRGDERIGGNSGVYSLLQSAPSAHVVLIRIKGLYGSIFSKALTSGLTPEVGPTILRGAQILIRNLFLLTPRRPVSIEVIFDPPDFPRSADSLTINRYLERFYNWPEPERVSLISYSRWNNDIPALPPPPDEAKALEEIPSETKQRILSHIASAAQVPLETVSLDTKLGDDLGLDSLTVAELLLWLDREFEVNDIELSEIVSVGSLVRAAAGQLSAHGSAKRFALKVPELWSQHDSSRPNPVLDVAATLPEAFLKTALRMEQHPALGDEKSGVIPWNMLKVGVILLAKHIRSLPGKHIGVLLPASAASSMVTMASMLAGKTPVLLNWTAGARSLLHACSATQTQIILSARSFLDSVPTDLEFLEDKLLFIEDIKGSFTLREKVSAKRLAGESTPQILSAFGLDAVAPDDAALVLFTSGSEAQPKGVPLTHRNLITNIRGILDAFAFHPTDVLLGFLPPFHSFGVTVCSLMPMITGLKVAYHPNPNESRKIVKAIAAWGATLMAGTPTFLRAIFKAGDGSQLHTLRAMVSGAERAPDELFALVQSITPQAQILEGYGITECSPVVSLTRSGEPRVGVGRPLLGISVKVVNPENLEPVPEGAQGLVLIAGLSVFNGYLDVALEPFLKSNGTRWYNSGDLGRLQDGQLIITGRLKRFIKIAGEMVSLSAIEEALTAALSVEDKEPTFACLAKGSEGEARPQLIVFSVIDISVERVNQVLKTAGFPHLVRVSEVKRVSAIPLLGTGKTNYQELKIFL